MATKKTVPASSTFTVNLKVSGELAINVQAATIEDAIAQAKTMTFENVVEQGFDNIDLNQPDVIGVYRMS